MERHSKRPLAALLVLWCLLLLPIVSSVPMSRSLHLRTIHQHPPSIKFTPQEMAMVAAANLGRAAARMDVEVNDYPGAGPNGKHDPPRGPGRA
ncbi:hypothetical protein ACP70R_040371 [Stipagrostis hirtigluma subsp. patula]